jgi:DNA gyrase subunit B
MGEIANVERVRSRPAMYVGDVTDGSGLHHLIWEIVANVVDLHLMRMATELHVDVTADSWVTIRDDGPGIQGDLQAIVTTPHTDPTRDGHHLHIHLTKTGHGVGMAVVNALSTRFEVETTCDGTRRAQAYERGVPLSEVRDLGPSDVEGTQIRFQPDPETFGSIAIDAAAIAERLQQLAWLNPSLRVFFQGARLRWRGGVRSWAEQVASGPPRAAFSTSQVSDGVFVDLAIAWADAGEPTIRSFVNMQETRRGTHVDGLWAGLSAFADAAGAFEDVRAALAPGLAAIIHVGLYSPRFGGPTREHLVSPVAGIAVRQVIERDLAGALSFDHELRSFLVQRIGLPQAPR